MVGNYVPSLLEYSCDSTNGLKPFGDVAARFRRSQIPRACVVKESRLIQLRVTAQVGGATP
jgi:hypothetical protein